MFVSLEEKDVMNILEYLNREGVRMIMGRESEKFFDIGRELIDLDVENG